MDPRETTRLIHELAREIGLDRIGVTRPGPSRYGAYYRDWLAAGQHGTMGYLARHVELRLEPGRILPGARSAICAALSYRREDAAPADGRPRGIVARYARGRDYHRVLKLKLRRLIERLREELGEGFEARVFVDTGPLLERELAAAAGIGWIGKNTLIVHERLGSYLLLGVALTTLEAEPDAPATDHCGSCRRCLDACPTQAFTGPYRMDASRCISYLTIEHRGPIDPQFHAAMGAWVFGCDICQEVCPFNRKAPPGRDADLMASAVPAYPDLLTWVQMRSGRYRRLTRGTALGRARRPMLRRNALLALRNVDADAAQQALGELGDDADALVRATVGQISASDVRRR